MQNSDVLRSRGAQTVRHVDLCRREASNHSRPFLEILNRLAFSMDATDARDQVYAFLAFQDPNIEQILPDYSLDTSPAYAVISASIAKFTGSLSIFGLVRGSKFPGLLPSWAVDWRLNKSTQGKPIDSYGKNNFDACKGYQYRNVGASFRLLSVRGKIIGQVAVVSSVAHESGQSLPQVWQLEEVVQSLVLASRTQGTPLLISDGGVALKGRVLAVLMAQDLRSFGTDTQRENTLDKMLHAYHNYKPAVKRDSAPEDASEIREFVRTLSRRKSLCEKKRVFCSKGDLIGLGPQDIRQDDFICILHGSKVPCILRKENRRWQVIGQCFYELWMLGDLVDWKEEEGDPFDIV